MNPVTMTTSEAATYLGITKQGMERIVDDIRYNSMECRYHYMKHGKGFAALVTDDGKAINLDNMTAVLNPYEHDSRNTKDLPPPDWYI